MLRLTRLNAESQTDRIIREREILAQVDSRGVAKLVSADHSSDTPWIASEFVDGPTLRESIRTDGPLSAVEALSLVRRLAEILGELHNSGIAHRDLTPNNIVLGPDGPVIIDFGSARLDLENSATGSLLLAGTQGYTAPEVLRNEPAGRAADMFSLGRVAQFCVSGEDDGAPDFEPSIAALCADNAGDRPSANEIVELLAAFNSLPERHRKRDVEKLPRRFRLSTVVALVTAAALVAVLSGYFAFRPSPVTTAELLNVEGLPLAEPAPGAGHLNVDSRFFVSRQRPLESALPESVRVVESVVVRGDESLEDGEYVRFHSQLFLRDMTESDISSQQEVVPEDVLLRLDSILDQLEVWYLSTGCVLQQAEIPLKINDSVSLLAASMTGCEQSPLETVFAGVLWSRDSQFLTEFAGQTSSTIEPKELLSGLEVSWDYEAARVTEETTLLEINNLSTPWIDTSGWDGPTESSRGYGNFAIKLQQGEAVEVRNVNADAQVSALFLHESHHPSGWVPAGRWWTRQEGESRLFSNPFSSPTILMLEVEGIYDDEPLDFAVSSADSQHQLYSLPEILDDILPTTAEQTRLSERDFALPINPQTSPDNATQAETFWLNGLALEVETSLIVGAFSVEQWTDAFRADDTFYDGEFTYLERHDPHWFLGFGPTHEFMFGVQSTDWVYVGEVGFCRSQNEWTVHEGDFVANIRAALDCVIDDAWRFEGAEHFVPQTNPIFYFSFGSASHDDEWLVGSFAPESVEELDRFKAFLADVISRGDEIAAAWEWE